MSNGSGFDIGGLPAGLTMEQAGVLKMIDAYPVHIDELSRKAGMDIGRLSGLLLNLELRGLIVQRPGKYFCLKEEPH
jgi:DNA processing protein